MNWRYMALFGALVVLASVFAAPANAAVTNSSSLARWTGGSALGNVATEGGNVTAVNLTTESLTDKWAAFFGNLTGTIRLTDAAGAAASKYVYSWTAGLAQNGSSVCAANGTINFGGTVYAVNNVSLIALNTALGHGAAADNVTNTYTTSCNITFLDKSVTGSLGVKTGGNFTSCGLTDTTNYAICTAVNATGKNYKGQDAEYELLVPTHFGTSTDTYYFYAELA